MKDELSKEDNKDLPIEVINVDIHNKALFMFLSMLKCSKMGNYKLRDSAYIARESCYKETPFFDAVWVDPKENSDFLLIEVKTRMVGDYEVNYEDRIIKDVVSKTQGLINNDMDIPTTGYKFIVPVFIYKKEHRAYNQLGYANLLVIWGDKNFYCVSAVNTIEYWAWFFSDQHDIDHLFFSLEEIPHYQGNYIINRKEEASKPVLNVEQYLEDKDPEQKEPQAASDVPMINKHYKNLYLCYKYNEHVFETNDFYNLLYKSNIWNSPENQIKTSVLKSLARYIYKDVIDLVIEYNKELMIIPKKCISIQERITKRSRKYQFNNETRYFLKKSTKIIILVKPSLKVKAKIDGLNKGEYELFSNYMDSINTDDTGRLSDSA